MTVRVGPYTFGHASYDEFGDVLYLRTAKGQGGVSDGETPEGHAFLHPVEGGSDAIVGIDIERPKAQRSREGCVRVTLPTGERVDVPDADALIT